MANYDSFPDVVTPVGTHKWPVQDSAFAGPSAPPGVLLSLAQVASQARTGEQIAQPDKPADGFSVFWTSNGTGTVALGAVAGDFCVMSTEGVVTSATVLHVHSTAVVIP